MSKDELLRHSPLVHGRMLRSEHDLMNLRHHKKSKLFKLNKIMELTFIAK